VGAHSPYRSYEKIIGTRIVRSSLGHKQLQCCNILIATPLYTQTNPINSNNKIHVICQKTTMAIIQVLNMANATKLEDWALINIIVPTFYQPFH
jgi:hypothetical protein